MSASPAVRNLAAWVGAAAAAFASAGMWLASRPGAPLSALGYEGSDHASFCWVALVPMMVWLDLVPQRTAAWAATLGALGMGAGMAFLAASGAALTVLPALVGRGYPEADAQAVVWLAAAIQAVPAATATVLTCFAVRRGRRAPGFMVFAWVAAEGLSPLGSERLAVALYEHPEWIALASLGGPSLVSLLVALVNGAVAECVLLIVPPRRRPYLVFAAAGALAGSLGIHAVRAEALATATNRAPTVSVLVVQGDGTNHPALVQETAQTLRRLRPEQMPDVVVWPTTGLSTALEASELDLAAWLPSVEAPFVVNTPMVRGAPPEGPNTNALVLTDTAGQRKSLYQATVLAPFLDFAPFPELLPDSLQARIHHADRRPGQHGAMFEIASVPFGVMVGWDDISGPDLRRQLDDQDPEWLLSVVDDRDFVGTPLPEYHYACAVFRAVEQGRFLVRAAAEGGSALIDPLGAVRSRSTLGQPFAEVVVTPRLHAATGYRVVGNFATPICLLFVLSLTLLRPAQRPGVGPNDADPHPEVA